MQLVNVAAEKRKVYLFCRNDKGDLKVSLDDQYYPYYYEPDTTGAFTAIDGTKLKRVTCQEPNDVKKQRSSKSYEADVPYTRRYVIDKIPKFDKCPIRYCFVDIEILTDRELPNWLDPKYPISCITAYDSFNKEYHTWYMGDLTGNLEAREQLIISGFIEFLKKTKPDVWFSWNVDFDYNYLHARWRKFAEQISPIGSARPGGSSEGKLFYPNGISIVDYLTLFKKVYMREQSYRLDAIAVKYLNEQPWGETLFGKLDPIVKDKNLNDVVRLNKLEEKFKLIDYYNDIRLLSRCQWEDLKWNSRIVEMMLFEEAKAKNVVLPNKPKHDDDSEPEEFQGAAREACRLGVSEQVYQYDVSSCYPSMIKDFCLDSANIVTTKSNDVIDVNGVLFKQDSNTILPSIISKVLALKDNLKKELNKQKPGTEAYELAKTKYAAIKSVTNSQFGVIGNRYFRLYSKQVAESITFLARSLILHVKAELDALGNEVIYYDTDGIMVDSKKDIKATIDSIVSKWTTGYGKKSLSTSFEYAGKFEKLLILGRCRYYGLLATDKGLQEEIKGIEMKRGDSSKFMVAFQKELINKVLTKVPKDDILKYIVNEAKAMRTKSLVDIAFPVKINKDVSTYKTIPIFVRALKYTQELVKFDKVQGELFYYVYVDVFGYEQDNIVAYYNGTKRVTDDELLKMTKEDKDKLRTRKLKPKSPKNVIAFDANVNKHVGKVDYVTMTDRNILSKCEVIFNAMGWADDFVKLKEQVNK